MKQNSFLGDKMKIEEKTNFFEKKNQFWMKFENPPKNVKKLTFFSKKSWILFSLNFTSKNRKIILKLNLKSDGSNVYAFEALNAPKTHVGVLARLKSQNLPFSAENSRIFDFQILKMARLKPVSENWDWACVTWSTHSKDTSPVIS